MRPFVFLLLAGVCSGQSLVDNARETARRTRRGGGFVSISDWSRGSSPFCFLTDCLSDASQVPDGTGYFSLHGDFSIEPVTFEFPGPVDTLSLFATAVGPTTVRAFDAAGVEVGSQSVPSVMAADWSSNTLLMSAPDMQRIQIYAHAGVIDQLTFGSTAESFEGYLPDDNAISWWNSNLAPQGEFVFASGLILKEPTNNILPPGVSPDIAASEPSGIYAWLILLFGLARRKRNESI